MSVQAKAIGVGGGAWRVAYWAMWSVCGFLCVGVALVSYQYLLGPAEALSGALNQTREQLEKTEGTIPRQGEQIKLLETMIENEMDPVKRAQLDFEVKELKRSVEVYKRGVTQLREREQEQAAQLREQQGKLAELERRLEHLEEQIEGRFSG